MHDLLDKKKVNKQMPDNKFVITRWNGEVKRDKNKHLKRERCNQVA